MLGLIKPQQYRRSSPNGKHITCVPLCGFVGFCLERFIKVLATGFSRAVSYIKPVLLLPSRSCTSSTRRAALGVKSKQPQRAPTISEVIPEDGNSRPVSGAGSRPPGLTQDETRGCYQPSHHLPNNQE